MLTTAQLQLISLIVSGHTYAEAADAIGVTPRTVTNWVARKDFADALDLAKNEVRKDMMQRVTLLTPDPEQELKDIATTVSFNLATRLTGLIPTVLDTLEEILTNKKARDGDRIRAGQVICDLAGLTRANTVNVNVGTQSMDQADLKELPDEEFRQLIGLPSNLDLSRVSDEDVMRLAGVEDTEWNQEP